MDRLIARLSPGLFWDVDPERVRLPDHGGWLVSRVLEGGDWQDWTAISNAFVRAGLQGLEPRLRIDPKARHFLRTWLSL
jgi:hypothetical protein